MGVQLSDNPATKVSLSLGHTVRITTGTLAGLTGILTHFTPDRGCLLTINGFPPGIQIIVSSDHLHNISLTHRP